MLNLRSFKKINDVKIIAFSWAFSVITVSIHTNIHSHSFPQINGQDLGLTLNIRIVDFMDPGKNPHFVIRRIIQGWKRGITWLYEHLVIGAIP